MMDKQNKGNQDIITILKQPYVKTTVIIAIIIIIAMYLTQSYWINTGIKVIYNDYNAEEVLPTNNIPDGIFILSGNFSYISEWINTSKFDCADTDNVKLLVATKNDFGSFKNVIVLDTIEGCGK